MVTYYNTKDMVSFGNYLMEKIRTGEKQEYPDGKFHVSHADMENWKEEMRQRKES